MGDTYLIKVLDTYDNVFKMFKELEMVRLGFRFTPTKFPMENFGVSFIENLYAVDTLHSV